MTLASALEGRSEPQPLPALDLAVSAHLFRMLSSMLSAGIPISRALYSLREDPQLNRSLSRILHSLESGQRIHLAFQVGGFRDKMLLRMLYLAESTGTLDTVLEGLARLLEWRVGLRAELRAKMLYPALLSTCCALLVGLGPPLLLRPILDFVVSSGQPLPLMTRAVILLADALSSAWFWLMMAGVSILLWYGFGRLKEQHPGAFENCLLGCPRLGGFLSLLYSVRFAKALLACLSSGFPLVSSLTLAAECSGSLKLSEQAERACSKLIAGSSSEDCWSEMTLLDPLLRSALSIGIASGKVEQVLAGVLAIQEDRWRHSLERCLALLEPILLAMMGSLVALCMVATVSPLMSLLEGLG